MTRDEYAALIAVINSVIEAEGLVLDRLGSLNLIDERWPQDPGARRAEVVLRLWFHFQDRYDWPLIVCGTNGCAVQLWTVDDANEATARSGF